MSPNFRIVCVISEWISDFDHFVKQSDHVPSKMNLKDNSYGFISHIFYVLFGTWIWIWFQVKIVWSIKIFKLALSKVQAKNFLSIQCSSTLVFSFLPTTSVLSIPICLSCVSCQDICSLPKLGGSHFIHLPQAIFRQIHN